MKLRFIASSLMLVSALSAPHVSAAHVSAASNVTCNHVSVRDVGGDDYTFQASVKCTAQKSGIQAETIRQNIMEVLKENGTVKDEEETSVDGMNGSTFEYRDGGYDTGHGTIRITFDAHLVADNSQVAFSGVMKSKVATDKAQHTEAVTLEINANVSETQVDFTLTKLTTISKPHLVPEGMFKRGVHDGLTKELTNTLQDYKQMLNSL